MKETEETHSKLSERAMQGMRKPPPATINTIGLMQRTGNGDFTAECDHALSKVVAAIMEIHENENRDCSGAITIKIDFKTRSGALITDCHVAAKMPSSKPISGLVWADQEGGLHENDPAQARFNFINK